MLVVGVCVLVLAPLLLYCARLLLRPRRHLLHLPGPAPLPLLGNALLFAGDHLTFIPVMRSLIGEITALALFTYSHQLDLIQRSTGEHSGCISGGDQI